MAQENFNVSEPNDGLGDKLRAAFIKQQSNNTELYTNKVDKEIGKGLSSENYTTTEKNKLDNIEDFAEVNVQSDMAQNDETANDFIKNKLSIFGLATTQIINVGSIGNVPIQDVVNLDDGYVIQGQELGIRLVTSNDNGVAKNYLFLAPGGNYGIDLLQTVAADFQIFGTEGGGVVINDTTPSLTEVYSSQKVEDELNLIAGEILEKQNIPRLVDTDTTVLNNEILHVTADATITDVVGAVVGDVYKVVVINGLATIGGQIYGKGETIERYFDGTIYITTLPNGQKYIDVTANATVTNDWYLAIVRIKATSTITIPSGLNRRIAFTCFAYPTITATFVAGAGETVTSAKGLVLKNGTTNSVFSDGLNAVIIIGEMTVS